jgi:TolB protein
MRFDPTRRAALGALSAAAVAPGLLGAGLFAPGRAAAQQPLSITVAGGNFRPIAIAIPRFLGEGDAARIGADVAGVVTANLTNSGLFRVVPPEAHIERIAAFDQAPAFESWRAVNAEALAVGRAAREADGRLRVEFRLWDVAAGEQIEGMQYFVDPAAWRRVAHKVSDAIYARLTGEGPYFDSRIVFVDETGPKGRRIKRLALMDQDGANLRYLTDGKDLTLTPRFSPTDQDILYISYETGEPQVFLLNLDTGQREVLGRFPGMTFSPRFSPDGRRVAMSLVQAGGTDIYLMELSNRQLRRLTQSPGIDTAPSFSPDGTRIVFESDRGGGQQLYVMSASGGEATAQRISFGQGRYATPVWSPRGDLIAFTRQGGGQFSIGVMKEDGSGEKILFSSYHAEGPTWSPNGRVLAFFQEGAGAGGGSALWSVDVTGMNLRRLATPHGASDPAWSPLLP